MNSSSNAGTVTTIEFQDDGGVSGQGRQGRRWHIMEERSGWRLSFRDPGDDRATNAGIFGTLAAAQQEADGAGARLSVPRRRLAADGPRQR